MGDQPTSRICYLNWLIRNNRRENLAIETKEGSMEDRPWPSLIEDLIEVEVDGQTEKYGWRRTRLSNQGAFCVAYHWHARNQQKLSPSNKWDRQHATRKFTTWIGNLHHWITFFPRQVIKLFHSFNFCWQIKFLNGKQNVRRYSKHLRGICTQCLSS